MKIYAAIDILDGKAVRLRRGRRAEATVYGDPPEMATRGGSKGAEGVHVGDLGGAFLGRLKNIELLRGRAGWGAVPLAKIQVGGGIRSITVVETLLDAGIRRVVLGTAAVEDPAFVKQALKEQPRNIAVGIDALDGNVQVAGWTENSHIRAITLAKGLEELGARVVVYTDISRDGALAGPNIDATKEMLESTDLSVIASGGVSSIADLRHLAELDHSRLEGVIIGKALYEGLIGIEEALANAR